MNIGTNKPREAETFRIDNGKWMNMLLCLKGASKSFDFCTAWTSACCRLDVDQCRRVRRLSSNKCKPQTMWAGHVRLRNSDVCMLQMILVGHVRRRLTDVCRPRTMRTGLVRRWKTDVCKPRTIVVAPSDIG